MIFRLLQVLAIALVLSFTGCSDKPASNIAELEVSLERQFKQQWEQKRPPENRHTIKSVHIDGFGTSGAVNYAEIRVVWDHTNYLTQSPVVPIGSATAFTVGTPENPNLHLTALVTFK
jgi:hypothetical protein